MPRRRFKHGGRRKNQLGRPPLANPRTCPLHAALTELDMARLRSVPGGTDSERIEWLLDHRSAVADSENGDFSPRSRSRPRRFPHGVTPLLA